MPGFPSSSRTLAHRELAKQRETQEIGVVA